MEHERYARHGLSQKAHNRQKEPCKAHREHYAPNLGMHPVEVKNGAVSPPKSGFQTVLENYVLKALYNAQKTDYRHSDCILFVQNWLSEIKHPSANRFRTFRQRYTNRRFLGLLRELRLMGCMDGDSFRYSRGKEELAKFLPKTDTPHIGDIMLIESEFPALAIHGGAGSAFALDCEGSPVLHRTLQIPVHGYFSIHTV